MTIDIARMKVIERKIRTALSLFEMKSAIMVIEV